MRVMWDGANTVPRPVPAGAEPGPAGSRARAIARRGLGAARGRLPGLARVLRGAAGRLSDERGATAVEFAMVAAPFMILLGVILEIGFNTLAQQTLDLALERASRQLRTGTFQEAADGSAPGARLKRGLCASTFVLFACDDVRVEVASASAPSLPQPSAPYDPEAKGWNADFGTRFECPRGTDVIAVRAAVPVPRLLWFLDITGRVMADGRQLLVATRFLQSEAHSQKACA